MSIARLLTISGEGIYPTPWGLHPGGSASREWSLHPGESASRGVCIGGLHRGVCIGGGLHLGGLHLGLFASGRGWVDPLPPCEQNDTQV